MRMGEKTNYAASKDGRDEGKPAMYSGNKRD